MLTTTTLSSFNEGVTNTQRDGCHKTAFFLYFAKRIGNIGKARGHSKMAVWHVLIRFHTDSAATHSVREDGSFMGRTLSAERRFAVDRRRARAWVVAAASATAVLYAGDTVRAGTEVQFTTGGALTTAASYSSGVAPTNANDVRLTTTTTGLTITSGSVVMESLNNTSGTSYSISNATTTATGRTLTLGNGGTFTDAVSGVNNDLIYVGGTGSLTLTGTNSSTGTGSLGLTLTSAGNFNVSSATLTINTLITSTSLALTKTGTGTLVLSNNGNSGTLVLPTGGLVLNAGTLQINGGGALGSTANGGGVTLTGNATIRNSGLSATAGLGSSRTLAIGTNNLTLDTAGNTFAVNGAITGSTGSVNLINGGLISFTNANTYTGTTTVTGSLSTPSGLTLSGSNASSGYTVSNAALTLTSTGSFTAAAPTLALASSSFTVATGRSTTLTLGGLTLSGAANSVNAGSVGVDLGAITRTAGTVDFTLPAAGSLTTTTANGSAGIFAGWATVNSGAAFATSAGTGSTAGAITAFGPGPSDYGTAGGTTNFDAAASGTFSGSAVNSIRLTAPATLTLGGGFTVTSGGVLVTPTAGSTASAITGGSITGGGSELYVHQYDTAAALTLATPVVDNAGSVSLVKTGGGRLIISAANLNTGVTTIGAGTLQIGDGATGSLGGAAIVDNGVLSFNLPGTVTTSVGISGSGSVQQDGPGTLVFAAGTSFAGGTTVNNGGIQFSTTNNAGTGGFRINNGFLRQTAGLTSARSFTLGAATSTVDVSNGFTFNISGLVTGTGTLNVNSTTTQSTTGVADTGQLSLSNATNTYTGGTVLNAGLLMPYFGTSLGTGPLTVNNNTRVVFNNFNSTANTVSAFAGNVILNGSADTIQVGGTTFRNTLTFTGNVSGPATLVQTGPGTLTLAQTGSNSYTGGTVVNQGLLIGSAGSFGTGDLTINPTSLTNGTAGLLVDAAGVISTNSIAPTANVTVNSNTTNNPGVLGTLTFGGTANTIGTLSGNGQVALGAGTVTLGNGTAAATSTTFTGVVSGSGVLTKSGAGTQTLTGANSYTGGTIVTGGTLAVSTSAATVLLAGTGTDIQNGAVSFVGGNAATIRSLLVTGFATGFTTGTLRSTTATANRGLGYKDDGTAVIVKATLYGDADLDGGVSINDFNLLATNFGQSGKVWIDGDFDYDGGVSINDFNLLATNFGSTLPASADSFAGLLAFAAAHNDLAAFEAVTGVPEPTSLGLIAAGMTLGLRRRRA